MKRIGVLAIAVAMTVAACGGSNETVAEPDVEVEVVDDDGAFRLAGGGQVINGCRIEPNTQCPGANLSFAVLFRANLSDANLRGANLAGANLSWANLSNADLYGAGLREANLSGADLSGASLWYANLYGAWLLDASMSGADLSWADLRRANLSRANLSGANLRGARFCDTTMPDGKTRNDHCSGWIMWEGDDEAPTGPKPTMERH